ncbi:MAG: hypothetical protein ACREOO_21520 [bacterium]
MELGRYFSLRDFFNYYIAGFIWSIDAYLLYKALISDASSDLLKHISPGSVLFGICAVIFPYLTGFVFSGIGNYISKEFYGCFGGDPLDWVFKFKGKKLNNFTIKQCAEFAHKLFEIPPNAFEAEPKRYFFQIRNYVEHLGGSLNNHVERLQDLETLAESLSIPLPLLTALVVYNIPLSNVGENFYIIKAFGCMMVFCGLFSLIMKRHLKLREYRVKHIYRTFVVLSITRPHTG